MLNLFFGFRGRLRRRDFLLWSLAVPCALVIPPAFALAASAAHSETGLMEDLQASGMVWPFFLLIALSQYISVALFWKRMNDVSTARRKQMFGDFFCYAYAFLTAMSALITGLNMVALGSIEGSAAGLVLLVFWKIALWSAPERGPNEHGDDPRTGAGWFGGPEDSADIKANTARIEMAMERALTERVAPQASSGASQSFQKASRLPEIPRPQKPSFGKR